MQHTHHIRNYKVNLNLTANTAFYHTPVIAHTLEDIVIIPIIGDSRQVLKIEDTTGCDQEDNGGKCNQQIGGAVQLDDFCLPLPCTRKIDVLRHSVFQNRIGSPIGTGCSAVDADNSDLFRLSACYGLIKLVGDKKRSNTICKPNRIIQGGLNNRYICCDSITNVQVINSANIRVLRVRPVFYQNAFSITKLGNRTFFSLAVQ